MKKKITAENIAELADQGVDVTKFLSKPEKGHFSKKLREKNIQRTTIDFGIDMIEDLDKVAQSLNISRQAVVKMALQEWIDRHRVSMQSRV